METTVICDIEYEIENIVKSYILTDFLLYTVK